MSFRIFYIHFSEKPTNNLLIIINNLLINKYNYKTFYLALSHTFYFEVESFAKVSQ